EGALALANEQGQPVALQAGEPSAAVPGNWRRRLTFLAELPPLGYRVYHLSSTPPATPDGQSSALSVSALPGPVVNGYTVETDGQADLVLENSAVRLRLDGRLGALASLVDKRTGLELLAGPAVAQVLADPSDTWSHGVTAYRDVCGQFSGAGLKVIESG